MSNKLEEAAAQLIQEIKRHPAIVSEQQYNEWYKRILEIAHQPPAESVQGDRGKDFSDEVTFANVANIKMKSMQKEIESLKSQLQSEREKNARVVEALKEINRSIHLIRSMAHSKSVLATESSYFIRLISEALQQSGSSMQQEGGYSRDQMVQFAKYCKQHEPFVNGRILIEWEESQPKPPIEGETK